MTQQRVMEQLAQAIRAAYIDARRKHEEARTGRRSNYTPGPHWDGGVTKRTRVRRKNYWLVLAKALTERGIDFQEFIDHVFANWQVKYVTDRGMFAPAPNIFGSTKYQAMFLKDDASGVIREKKRRAFAAQQQEASRALLEYEQYGLYKGKKELLSAVLSDSSLSLSALFRYCCAFHEGLPKICKIYKQQALLQYGRSIRHYNAVWGEWIPGPLREEAEQVFEFYGGRNGQKAVSR